MSFERIQAIQAQARSGAVDAALNDLRQLILDRPYDLHLWRLFAELATEPEDIAYALENVLEINPNDQGALARLKSLPIAVRRIKRLPGVAMGVSDMDDQTDEPSVYLAPDLMERFGYAEGEFARVRGEDGEVTPLIVRKAHHTLAKREVQLNGKAQRLLDVYNGGTVALLPDERLVLLVDTSASMSHRLRLGVSRMSGTKKAINLLLDAKLREGDDLVGLIRFDDNSELLIKPSHNYDEVRASVRNIRLGGSTNMRAGLLTALRELEEGHGLKRIILLTDGVPTNSTDEEILGIARRAKREGVVIDTIGLGERGQRNYNESLLRGIAEITGGEFRKVEDLESLKTTFEQLATEKRYLLTD